MNDSTPPPVLQAANPWKLDRRIAGVVERAS
jgi:hypothetical protein